MSFKSLAVLPGLIAILWNSIPGVQATCTSNYGVTLYNGLELVKNGVIVTNIDKNGGTYTVKGKIDVSSSAAVSSLNLKLSVSVKVKAKLWFFTSSFEEPVPCANGQVVCEYNHQTCSALETLLHTSGICDANSNIASGRYAFQLTYPIDDFSAELESKNVIEATVYATVEFYNSSNGSKVGCLTTSIGINV